jgi:hypothetical protein
MESIICESVPQVDLVELLTCHNTVYSILFVKYVRHRYWVGMIDF